MNKGIFLKLGFTFILLGVVMFLNSAQNITGYAIFEGADLNVGYYVGAWCVVFGLVLLYIGKSELHYRERDSSLKEMLGSERYGSLSERDRILLNKSYRRHLERGQEHAHQKTAHIVSREEIPEPTPHGKVPTTQRELLNMAREMGYEIQKGEKSYIIRNSYGRIITTIGHHREIGKGKAAEIYKSLDEGNYKGRDRKAA